MSILPLLLSLLALNTVSCSEAPSRAQLLEMVQNLTGRLEKVEEKGNLLDAVEKLGGRMAEKLTEGLEELGQTLTRNEILTDEVDKLGEKIEELGEALTGNDMSSCVDMRKYDRSKSVHTLRVDNKDITVFCDQDTAGGGWTVIQQRRDGSVDFCRNWEEYRQGFGDTTGGFWMGLDNIHLLTTARNQTLRVDLQDFDNNTAYAEYRFFAIDGPDSFYRLHVDGYTGTADDSLAYHNNRPFSTHDSDHDLSSGNCAVDYHGAWWYNECHHSNLNGPYLTSAQQTHGKSISWRHWKKWYIALKHAEMKIRPAM